MTDRFDDDIGALEASFEGAAGMAAAFRAELTGVGSAFAETGRHVGRLDRKLSSGLSRAFDDLVFDGAKLSDVMGRLAGSLSRSVYGAAMKPVFDGIGGMITGGLQNAISGLLPFENGAPFSQGRVVPFASGGVVRGPTTFPMRGATGLMGEAGPEAIMPLKRGPDGRLGVAAEGGGRAVNVTINVTTPDVDGFARSRSQIAAQMARALGQAQRNR